MKVGFTGTRHRMTYPQERALARLITRLLPDEFHHGDCVGADELAVRMVWLLTRPESANQMACRIVCHPPVDPTHRANFPHYDEMRTPKTHFARNRSIVDACDVLIAVPQDATPQLRGGTWYTINYARKVRRRVLLIRPEGAVECERISPAQQRCADRTEASMEWCCACLGRWSA